MTKKEKREHIEEIKAIVKDSGFKPDSHGNYKTDSGAYRIKFKKINIRLESKTSYGWIKLYSKPYVNTDIKFFKNALNSLKKG